MPKYNTLERKIATRISRQKSAVVMREDFDDLGGYDQVGRTLRQLAAKGVIVKIGYGLYARAKPSYFSGKLIPEKPMPEIAREALGRLGVEIFPSTLERAYIEKRTNQVLTGRVIGVKDRISRKIGYNGTYVSYERLSR